MPNWEKKKLEKGEKNKKTTTTTQSLVPFLVMENMKESTKKVKVMKLSYFILLEKQILKEKSYGLAFFHCINS